MPLGDPFGYGLGPQRPRTQSPMGLPSMGLPRPQTSQPPLNTGMGGLPGNFGPNQSQYGPGGGVVGPMTQPANRAAMGSWMANAPMGNGLPGQAMGMSSGGVPAPQGQPGGNVSFPYGTTQNLGQYGSGWAQQPYQYQGPGQFNIQADPGFIFARDQAMEAIQNSAAARGSLHSTGTMNDMSDRLTGLGHQFANDAYGRFADGRNFGRSNFESDRGFGEQSLGNAFGRFFSDRGFMDDRQRYNQEFNYRGFRDQQGDFNQRMALQQMASQGLAGNAQDWSRLAATMPAVFSQIIAQLHGSAGQAQAQGIQGQNANNQNFVTNLLGLIPNLLGGIFN